MIFIPSIVSTALRWGFDYVHRLLYFMKSFFRAPLWGGGSIFLVVYSLREGIVWGVDFCCAVDAVRWLGIYCRHMPLCDLFSALFLFAVNKEINVADHSLISVLGLAWSLHFRPRFEDLEYCLLFLVCFWLSHDWAKGVHKWIWCICWGVHFLFALFYDRISGFPWKAVWKMSAPPRVALCGDLSLEKFLSSIT